MNSPIQGKGMGDNVQRLIRDFSIEALPKDVQKLGDLANHLPRGTRVYVAYTSGSTAEIVAAAETLHRQGMDPVPHVPARRFGSYAELRDFLSALTSRAGVRKLLLVGGDTTRPTGPYTAALDVLRTGMLEGHGIRSVGFAGHPEGHPTVSREVLRAALIDKCQYAERAGLDVWVTTQFLFDTKRLFTWHADFVAKTVPTIAVDVGLPGLAKMSTLLRFARDCGVGASLGMLTRHAGRAFMLATAFAPDEALGELAAGMTGRPVFRSVHFYPFGSFERTAAWLRDLRAKAVVSSEPDLTEVF